MAHPGLPGCVAHPCAARRAALAGGRPRAAPAGPSEPALDRIVLALSTRCVLFIFAIELLYLLSAFNQVRCAGGPALDPAAAALLRARMAVVLEGAKLFPAAEARWRLVGSAANQTRALPNPTRAANTLSNHTRAPVTGAL